MAEGQGQVGHLRIDESDNTVYADCLHNQRRVRKPQWGNIKEEEYESSSSSDGYDEEAMMHPQEEPMEE